MTLQAGDYDQIRQLHALYTQGADRGDEGLVADCFTADAGFYLQEKDAATEEQTYLGRARIEELVRSVAAGRVGVTQHWISGAPNIQGDDEIATSEVYIMVVRVVPGHGAQITVTGVYRDVLARVDGRWLISERVFVPNPQ